MNARKRPLHYSLAFLLSSAGLLCLMSSVSVFGVPAEPAGCKTPVCVDIMTLLYCKSGKAITYQYCDCLSCSLNARCDGTAPASDCQQTDTPQLYATCSATQYCFCKNAGPGVIAVEAQDPTSIGTYEPIGTNRWACTTGYQKCLREHNSGRRRARSNIVVSGNMPVSPPSLKMRSFLWIKPIKMTKKLPANWSWWSTYLFHVRQTIRKH